MYLRQLNEDIVSGVSVKTHLHYADYCSLSLQLQTEMSVKSFLSLISKSACLIIMIGISLWKSQLFAERWRSNILSFLCASIVIIINIIIVFIIITVVIKTLDLVYFPFWNRSLASTKEFTPTSYQLGCLASGNTFIRLYQIFQYLCETSVTTLILGLECFWRF